MDLKNLAAFGYRVSILAKSDGNIASQGNQFVR